MTPRPRLIRGLPFVVRVDYAGQPEAVDRPRRLAARAGCRRTTARSWSTSRRARRAGTRRTTTRGTRRRTTSRSRCPRASRRSRNGRLLSKRTADGKTTWRWLEDSPMAPYLATATNGVFELRTVDAGQDPALPRGRPGRGPERRVRAARGRGRGHRVLLRSSTARTRSRAAAAWSTTRPSVGYALESQTKSQYDQTPDPATVVHEISHQWFGNAVTLTVWPDIWLNEGFATLLGVDLRRAARRPDGAGAVRRVLRASGDRTRSGHGRRRTWAAPRSCSPARRTTAAR